MKTVANAVTEASGKPLERCAELVRNLAVESLGVGGRSIGPDGGKIYTPAPVGSPPHVQTGVLRSSISWAIDKTTNSAIVGTTTVAYYGKYHEHGLRPFMQPALERAQAEFGRFFKGLKIKETPTGRAIEAETKP